MTRIEVDADTIAALGDSLREVADDLAWQAGRSSEQAWALGPGDSAGALASVLGGFEHQRQLLGRRLDDLAAATALAGRLYAEVESRTAADFEGGAR